MNWEFISSPQTTLRYPSNLPPRLPATELNSWPCHTYQCPTHLITLWPLVNSNLPPKSRKLQTSKHPDSSFVFMLTSEWLPFLYVTWMCSVLSCMSFCRHVFNILVYAYTFRSSISGSLRPRLINTWPRALPSSPPRGPSARTAPPLLVPHSSTSVSTRSSSRSLF